AVLLLVPMWIQSLTKSDFSILLQWYDDPQYLLSFPTRRSSDLDIAPLLGDADLELLKKNAKAALYEPLVGAAAHALATVCDRVRDRKSTRLNSSHRTISYAVFCLKKKRERNMEPQHRRHPLHEQ